MRIKLVRLEVSRVVIIESHIYVARKKDAKDTRNETTRTFSASWLNRTVLSAALKSSMVL
jgi:hypothetical protein